MIDARLVQRLKQTNISEDGEKTKARVQKLWKSASKDQKHAIEETAGISRATIYRVYNTGSVSAKLVTPMSVNFNVNPKYLTGEIDEPGECTVDSLVEFLKKHGYDSLLTPEMFPASFNREEEDELEESDFDATELSLEDISLLVQSILLRERAGVGDAAKKAASLRALLLS